MRLHRELTVITAALVMLAGCGQDSNVQILENIPEVEPTNATSKDFGDYVLYFNAMTTDQLEPEVARAYNIVRSNRRAMVSISIIKKEPDTIGGSVAGSIDVKAVNLTGQQKNLSIRKIQDGDAIYYIGDVPVASGEKLVYDINVTPVNETKEMSVRFSHQFFAD